MYIFCTFTLFRHFILESEIVDFLFAGIFAEMLMELPTEEEMAILGIKNDLLSLHEKIEIIRDVLSDAERRRIQDKAVNGWLFKLKDVMYDADDIIDLCRIKGREQLEGDQQPARSSLASSLRVRFSSLFSSSTTATSIPIFRHEIGEEIERLNSRLEEIFKDRLMLQIEHSNSSSNMIVTNVKPLQTSSLPRFDIVGRKIDEAANKLVNSLVKSGERTEIIAIVGLGGIGKTALAQRIYNHKKMKANFQMRLWVCVSQNYTEAELLKQIITSASGDCDIHAQTTTELLSLLISVLSGKKFFLVMDDVWRADVWEDLLRTPFELGASSSRILITTRNKDVAKGMQAIETHQVDKLSTEDGWLLLRNIVFRNGADDNVDDLYEIGKKIVEKCDGLPLAIKTISGVLRTKDKTKGEWENVYRSHAWLLEGDLPEEVRGALYLSYADLPSHLKQCFLYCSIFPEDFKFNRWDLTRHWIAEGFVTAKGDLLVEDIADNYYDELISRNLLLVDPSFIDQNWCTMHDLVRSLCLFLAQDESCFVGANKFTANPSSKIRRLGITGGKELSVVLTSLKHPQCLRTLVHENHQQINTEDLFQRFRNLRILALSTFKIDNIPNSIRNLQHLRYLDLRHTTICELPDSIGCLINLLHLGLPHCHSLCTLPKGITRLRNLRSLHAFDTPLSHMPAGIGKLKHLNRLLGFVVGDGDDQESQQFQRGCSFDELQSLSQLRILTIKKLERGLTGGVRSLEDKSYLKILYLDCTPVVAGQALNSTGIEQTFEELSPSPSLEDLRINWFFGLKFPGWITMLPNLVYLDLSNCILCPQLPPLGQLPQLRIVTIVGASAIVTIGPEFLGHGKPTAFPKLEFLYFTNMSNWEEWTCDGDHQDNIHLLPRLNKLELLHCPKLRALPKRLQNATSLKILTIKGADSLKEIDNLPSLEELRIDECRQLERISNLPSLAHLQISSCGMLKSIENLNALQYLTLWGFSTDSLPECLSQLISTHPDIDVYRHNSSI